MQVRSQGTRSWKSNWSRLLLWFFWARSKWSLQVKTRFLHQQMTFLRASKHHANKTCLQARNLSFHPQLNAECYVSKSWWLSKELKILQWAKRIKDREVPSSSSKISFWFPNIERCYYSHLSHYHLAQAWLITGQYTMTDNCHWAVGYSRVAQA